MTPTSTGGNRTRGRAWLLAMSCVVTVAGAVVAVFATGPYRWLALPMLLAQVVTFYWLGVTSPGQAGDGVMGTNDGISSER